MTGKQTARLFTIHASRALLLSPVIVSNLAGKQNFMDQCVEETRQLVLVTQLIRETFVRPSLFLSRTTEEHISLIVMIESNVAM